MSAWNRAQNYLYFNRSDRIAILILVSLIVLLFFAPCFTGGKAGSTVFNASDTAWMADVNKLPAKEVDSGYETREMNHWVYDRTRTEDRPAKPSLFYFDPNTIDRQGWKKLGLRDKTIQTILNFRDKGGRFRSPEDLSRIYGLFDDEYERLRPYIRIEQQMRADQSYAASNFRDNIREKNTAPRYAAIDINTADTAEFIKLPGIGSKLAARIVNFRDKLGGFYSIEQIGETFGLADSVFQKIKPYLKPGNTAIKKININNATLDELKTHPYIRYAIAKTIIAYRTEHGPFTDLEDLRKVNTVTDELLSRIIPYLEL